MVGRLFFNIAGTTCYKYDHPVKRCAEYVVLPKIRLPPWILSVTNINANPERPRCRRYEYDISKPKVWQFFENFYEETVTNHRSEEPRSRTGRRKSLPLFQRLLLDFMGAVIGPY